MIDIKALMILEQVLILKKAKEGNGSPPYKGNVISAENAISPTEFSTEFYPASRIL